MNQGEIAFAWLRSGEVLRSGNDRAAAVDENGDAVDSADVRRTPVIVGDLRTSERLVSIHVYLTKS